MSRNEPYGVVYFARAGEDGPVKIGFSSQVGSRIDGLQVGAAEPLLLLRTINGGPVVERWLHKRFRDSRIRGEWFEFCPEMLSIDVPAVLQLPPPDADPSDAEFDDRIFGQRVAGSFEALAEDEAEAARAALLRRAYKEADALTSLAKQAAKAANDLVDKGNKQAAQKAVERADAYVALARRWAREYERHGGESYALLLNAKLDASVARRWAPPLLTPAQVIRRLEIEDGA